MKVTIHPSITKAINVVQGEFIEGHQPRLCVEFDKVENSEELFDLIINNIKSWETEFFFVGYLFDDPLGRKLYDRVDKLIVDYPELERFLYDFFSNSEKVVSITNPTNMSGCSIDWDNFLEKDGSAGSSIVCWGEYEGMASKLKDDYGSGTVFIEAKRFNVPTEVWNKMSKAEQWTANKKFLDRMINRGDNIVLSNSIKNSKNASGVFRKELNYLMKRGFRLSADGTRLIK